MNCIEADNVIEKPKKPMKYQNFFNKKVVDVLSDLFKLIEFLQEDIEKLKLELKEIRQQ